MNDKKRDAADERVRIQERLRLEQVRQNMERLKALRIEIETTTRKSKKMTDRPWSVLKRVFSERKSRRQQELEKTLARNLFRPSNVLQELLAKTKVVLSPRKSETEKNLNLKREDSAPTNVSASPAIQFYDPHFSKGGVGERGRARELKNEGVDRCHYTRGSLINIPSSCLRV
jgi:hypothetical protein